MISRRSSGIAKRSRVSGFSVPHFALSITRFIGSALAVSPASPNTSLLPFQAGWFFLLLRGILFRAFYILGSCAVCQTAYLLILGRGNAGDLFIYTGEMRRGLEAEVVRRGGDTIAGAEQFVGAADDKLMDETDGGIACRFAH